MNTTFIRQPFDFAYNTATNVASTVGDAAIAVASTIRNAAEQVYTIARFGLSLVIEKLDYSVSAIFSKAKDEKKEEPTSPKRKRKSRAKISTSLVLPSIQYVVEAHYDDGSRRLFGDPLFHDGLAAKVFGEHLMQVKRDHIEVCLKQNLPRPAGIITHYTLLPVSRQIGEETPA